MSIVVSQVPDTLLARFDKVIGGVISSRCSAARLPLLALLSFGHSRHHTTGVGGRADFRLNVITKLRGLAYWPPALLVKTATAPALPSKGPATRCTVTF